MSPARVVRPQLPVGVTPPWSTHSQAVERTSVVNGSDTNRTGHRAAAACTAAKASAIGGHVARMCAADCCGVASAGLARHAFSALRSRSGSADGMGRAAPAVELVVAG